MWCFSSKITRFSPHCREILERGAPCVPENVPTWEIRASIHARMCSNLVAIGVPLLYPDPVTVSIPQWGAGGRSLRNNSLFQCFQKTWVLRGGHFGNQWGNCFVRFHLQISLNWNSRLMWNIGFGRVKN